ncbi:MAG: LysM peptidoglycan-binding domain-containing protein, partial [Bacteroidota bacterium]
MKRIVFVSLILAFFITLESNGTSLDSLRLEKKDGQNFVIHKVTKGQTLFGTLRKYGTSLAEYKNANPEVALEIKIGQILRIPYNRPIKENISKKGEAKTFTVEPGMTLFSVARRNSITVSELKRLNNLTSDAIQSGQILIVKEGELSKSQKQIADKQVKKEVASLPKSTVENPEFKSEI